MSCTKSEHYIKKEYSEDGILLSEVEYSIKDSLRDGITKKYYETGELLAIGHYKKGVIQDTLKRFYKSGKIKNISVFIDNYNMNFEQFYQNGQTSTIGLFKSNNREYGLWKIYYEDGSLKDSSDYVIINGKSLQNNVRFFINDTIDRKKSSFATINLERQALKLAGTIDYDPAFETGKTNTYVCYQFSNDANYETFEEKKLDTIFSKTHSFTFKDIVIPETNNQYVKGYVFERHIKGTKPNVKDSTMVDITFTDRKLYFSEQLFKPEQKPDSASHL